MANYFIAAQVLFNGERGKELKVVVNYVIENDDLTPHNYANFLALINQRIKNEINSNIIYVTQVDIISVNRV